jgi:hypothetical protein
LGPGFGVGLGAGVGVPPVLVEDVAPFPPQPAKTNINRKTAATAEARNPAETATRM